MFKKRKERTIPETVPGFSYDILRNDVIPELLGEDESMILYYSGKHLARKHQERALEDLALFFEQTGWGRLTMLKEKPKQTSYELETPFEINERAFSLETGFLAQLKEARDGVVSEGSYVVKKKQPLTIEITILSDTKDPVD